VATVKAVGTAATNQKTSHVAARKCTALVWNLMPLTADYKNSNIYFQFASKHVQITFRHQCLCLFTVVFSRKTAV